MTTVTKSTWRCVIEALVKRSHVPQDVRVQQQPAPHLSGGDVLVAVHACGLCGSDVHAWRQDAGYEWVEPPVVLGHEAVGVVAAIGEGVDAAWAGRRVVPISISGCNTCDVCDRGLRQICPHRTVLGLSFDGAAAGLVRVPVDRLVEVPASIPAAVAALVEPLSVAQRATRHLTEPSIGNGRVVITGPGPIGFLVAVTLRRAGRDVLLVGAQADRDHRLALAESWGISVAVAGDESVVADSWVEASGSPAALDLALRSTRPGGTVVVPALYSAPPSVDVNLLTRSEIRLVGSYGSLREDYESAADLLAEDPAAWAALVTPFPLARAQEALEAAASGIPFKVALIP